MSYEVEIYDESEVPEDVAALIEKAFETKGVSRDDFCFCQYLEGYGSRSASYEHKQNEDITFYIEWSEDMELTECEVTED